VARTAVKQKTKPAIGLALSKPIARRYFTIGAILL
jgi:hypothetical protein